MNVFNNTRKGAMVMAQLAKQSLPIPEVRGSNPVIGKVFIEYCLLSTVLKSRSKRTRDRERLIFKIIHGKLSRYLFKSYGTVFSRSLRSL